MRDGGAAALKAEVGRRAADLAGTISELQANGASTLRAIAAGLNDRQIAAARGSRWSAEQVRRIMARLG